MNSTDFAVQYGIQLLASRTMITQLQGMVNNNQIPEDIIFSALDNTYDRAVMQFIDNAIGFEAPYVSIADISAKALANYHNTGTEPQFMLYAINDVYQHIIKNTGFYNLYPSGI